MKLLIHIDQRQSIKNGYNAPNSTEIFELDPIDMPQELREFVADHIDLKTGNVVWNHNHIITPLPATKEAVISVIQKLASQCAQAQANYAKSEQQKKQDITATTLEVLEKRKTHVSSVTVRVQRQRDKTISVRVNEYHCGAEWSASVEYKVPKWPYDSDSAVIDSPQAVAWKAELDIEREKAIADATERAIASMEADEKSTEERVKRQIRRNTQLEDALKTYGTELQKERHARGWLNLEKDIIPMIKDAMFSPLNDIPRTTQSQAQVKADVAAELEDEDAEYYGVDNVKFKSTEPAKTVSDEEMELVIQIEKLLPGCVAIVCEQEGYIESPDTILAGVIRRFIKVSITAGELNLSRNYIAP
jgi:hypothetical protein